MFFWDQSVEILRESILAYAQLCHGNLGWGILIVTFLTRLALMPFGIRAARAVLAHQQAMLRLQPRLDAIRSTWKGDSRRIAEETHRVMRGEGLSIAPPGLLSNLVQFPILIALYAAVRQAAAMAGRFLWIPNIAKPDWLLTAMVSGITLLSLSLAKSSSSPVQAVVVVASTIIMAAVLSKMAAGVGLYWGVSTLFGTVQGMIAGRTPRAKTA
jgi:YidC/Oxa1 family membrane protein insertase